MRPPYEPRTDVPWFDHQSTQAPEIRQLEAAALFWRVGTGKTRTDLEDTAWLYANDKIDAHVVVAPNGVHRAWVEAQIPVWLQGQPVTIGREVYPAWGREIVPGVQSMYFQSKSDSTKAYWAALEAFHERPGLRILTTYFEAFASKGGLEFVERFIKRAGRVKVTVDESHRIKAPGSLAATKLAKLRKDTAVRRIMTATPTANGPEDLYAQFRFLDPDILDCATFAEYKGMFVHEIKLPGTHFTKVAGYRNIPYLNKRIAPYVFVAKKPEGLPPQHWHTAQTSMSEEQRRHYDEMKYDYQTQFAAPAT